MKKIIILCICVFCISLAQAGINVDFPSAASGGGGGFDTTADYNLNGTWGFGPAPPSNGYVNIGNDAASNATVSATSVQYLLQNRGYFSPNSTGDAILFKFDGFLVPNKAASPNFGQNTVFSASLKDYLVNSTASRDTIPMDFSVDHVGILENNVDKEVIVYQASGDIPEVKAANNNNDFRYSGFKANLAIADATIQNNGVMTSRGLEFGKGSGFLFSPGETFDVAYIYAPDGTTGYTGLVGFGDLREHFIYSEADIPSFIDGDMTLDGNINFSNLPTEGTVSGSMYVCHHPNGHLFLNDTGC